MKTQSFFLSSVLAVFVFGAAIYDGRPEAEVAEIDDVALSNIPVAPRGLDDEEPVELKAITELKADSRGHFVTKARIDGTGLMVLVDTGASVVALSYEDAERANLKPRTLAFNVDVSTANGVAKAAPVMLGRVEVNGVRVHDVRGLVMPKGAMQGTLLGMSFLSRLESFRVQDGVLILQD